MERERERKEVEVEVEDRLEILYPLFSPPRGSFSELHQPREEHSIRVDSPPKAHSRKAKPAGCRIRNRSPFMIRCGGLQIRYDVAVTLPYLAS